MTSNEAKELIVFIVDEKISTYREGNWWENSTRNELVEAKYILIKQFKTRKDGT